jgi:flagellar basal body-associated protein FliL
MLANYLQHQRRNKMELFLILIIVGVSVFVGTSLAAILFLLQENSELNQDINDNQPPF